MLHNHFNVKVTIFPLMKLETFSYVYVKSENIRARLCNFAQFMPLLLHKVKGHPLLAKAVSIKMCIHVYLSSQLHNKFEISPIPKLEEL